MGGCGLDVFGVCAVRYFYTGLLFKVNAVVSFGIPFLVMGLPIVRYAVGDSEDLQRAASVPCGS